MLSGFEVSVVAAFTLADVAIMGAYVGERGETVKTYGKTFKVHVYGGLACVLFGALALLLFSLKMTTLGVAATWVQGASILALAGPAAFPLARYTSGLKGFNMLGYMGYTLAWLFSGLSLLWAPSLQAAYAAYVLTHAFLTCRIFVMGFEWVYKRWVGHAPDPSWNYSIATSIAAMIPLILAWGKIGVACFIAIWGGAILGHVFANSSRWHKLYRPEEDKSRQRRPSSNPQELGLVPVKSTER